jgi:hypothetical protein
MRDRLAVGLFDRRKVRRRSLDLLFSHDSTVPRRHLVRPLHPSVATQLIIQRIPNRSSKLPQ